MDNPYEVLGVPNGASMDQVKFAYREKIRQYQGETYQAGPRAQEAKRKMAEFDAAYDQIVMGGQSQNYSQGGGYGAGQGYGAQGYGSGTQQSYGGYAPDFSDIRARINAGRLDDAQMLLDGIPEYQRNAEWYYLKGTVHQRRGWLEEAARNFETARNMEPQNATYAAACDNIRSARNGGYKVKDKHKDSDCGCCSICSGLLCADCCCEAMGGDLIPCC